MIELEVDTSPISVEFHYEDLADIQQPLEMQECLSPDKILEKRIRVS